MKRRLGWLGVLAAATVLVAGCDSQRQLPDSPYPGASRDMMENPLGAQAKLKAIQSARAKKAQKNVENADPRNKARQTPSP
jgi:hypothetical protein